MCLSQVSFHDVVRLVDVDQTGEKFYTDWIWKIVL